MIIYLFLYVNISVYGNKPYYIFVNIYLFLDVYINIYVNKLYSISKNIYLFQYVYVNVQENKPYSIFIINYLILYSYINIYGNKPNSILIIIYLLLYVFICIYGNNPFYIFTIIGLLFYVYICIYGNKPYSIFIIIYKCRCICSTPTQIKIHVFSEVSRRYSLQHILVSVCFILILIFFGIKAERVFTLKVHYVLGVFNTHLALKTYMVGHFVTLVNIIIKSHLDFSFTNLLVKSSTSYFLLVHIYLSYMINQQNFLLIFNQVKQIKVIPHIQ